MNKRWISVYAFGLLCAFGFAQQKEESVEQLDEVVVSDSRFELKRENSGKTVIKIDRKEIERNQGRSVVSLINTKSGIEINGSRSNAGQNLGTYIRGGSNRQVMVLIDGVKVSDPSQIDGEYDLRLLSLGQIESIEIIKGAASALYGSGAATAVINITTKKAAEKAIALQVNSSFGTNQVKDDQNYNIADVRNNVLVSGTVDKFSYIAGFNHQNTNGMSAATTDANEKDPYSNHDVSLKLGYDFTDNFSVKVFGNVEKIKSDYDASAFADADNVFLSKQYRTGLHSEYTYNNGGVYFNGAYSKYDREFVSQYGSTFTSRNFVGDLYTKNVFSSMFHTIVGVNVIDDETEFDGKQSATSIDPYANVVFITGAGFNLNTGIRLNVHSEYGEHLTYNLNPSYSYDLGSGYVKVFGSYSTSFIAPSLSQLFGFYGPNPDLKPEEDKTLEGGLEYSLSKKLRISALYFKRDEKNLIAYDFNQGYYNAADKTTAQGVEVELSASPVEHLDFSANYTFTERKEEVKVRLPKHKMNASLGYSFLPGSYASLSYQYNSERADNFYDPDLGASVPVNLESYSLVDLYISHRLCKKVKLFGGIDNILNEDYTEVYGYNTRGRNVRLGFSVTL